MRVLLAVVIAVMGCGGEKKQDAPEKNDRTQETGHRTQDTGRGEAKPARPGLDEAEVIALVEEWKGAQNQGDFAAYQALYAKRMTGIKRVGPRVFTFDRAGWMKDRGRDHDCPC